jgi:hypothetical protein
VNYFIVRCDGAGCNAQHRTEADDKLVRVYPPGWLCREVSDSVLIADEEGSQRFCSEKQHRHYCRQCRKLVTDSKLSKLEHFSEDVSSP